MGVGFQVTFDCANPDALAQFWAQALDYQVQPPPPGYSAWPEFLKEMGYAEEEWENASAIVDPAGVGPRIFFQKVPEAKTVKNRVHLDVNVGGPHGAEPEQRRQKVLAAVERLKSLGATEADGQQEQHGEFWVVMRDPEGNEFCLQ